ncbi:MAG: hypothetical protein ACYC2R_06325 [Burkholderiales bacterium]
MKRIAQLMERAGQRFLAIFGWQPLGIVLAVFLVFALVADHFMTDYWTLSDQAAALEKKARDMKRKAGMQKMLEASLKEKQSLLDKQQARGFSAATSDLAGPLFLTEAQNLVQAARAQPKGGTVLPSRPENGLVVLQVEDSFEALTQQFVGVLEGIANSAKGMKILNLKVSVQTPETPALLTGAMTLQSFYVEPVKGDKSGGAFPPLGGSK